MSCDESEDWDFKQQCGSDAAFLVTVTDPVTEQPIDLTNASVKWIFAEDFGQAPLLVLSTGNGGDIATGGTNGQITGTIPAAKTSSIATTENKVAKHQMYLTLAGGSTYKIQQGTAIFEPKLLED